MQIETFRMSGAGNLFTVIDNRKYKFTYIQAEKLSLVLCNINEYNDYQSEGFMVINPSSEVDFKVWFFNPDGSSGMMCGNGGRCAVNFAAGLDFHNKLDFKFKMANSIYSAKILNDKVELILPAPLDIQQNIRLQIDNLVLIGDYVNVGSDHFVLNKNSVRDFKNIHLKEINVNDIGRKVRFYEKFFPKGVNCNIYQVIDNIIYLRTYERGVENETGACGTGAISTALSSYLNREIELPVTIFPTSGEALEIDIIFDDNDKPQSFKMLGPAVIIDKKIIEIPNNLFEK